MPVHLQFEMLALRYILFSIFITLATASGFLETCKDLDFSEDYTKVMALCETKNHCWIPSELDLRACLHCDTSACVTKTLEKTGTDHCISNWDGMLQCDPP
ncbi:hypothetical protein BDV12DRAFT_181293, partial [Aspergillus spectabilis]